MKGQKRIEKMFAFVVLDERDNTEGIASFPMPGEMGTTVQYPMVGADMARVESLRNVGQDIANLTGYTITIVEFDNRREVGTIRPESAVPKGPQRKL